MNHRYFQGLLPAARILPLAVVLITFSCKRLPEPDFSYIPEENPEAGDSIVFINNSADAESYRWEFGDGGTSTRESPVYIYEQSGIYDVKLTAVNEAGEESISRSVTINEPTVLGFFVYDSTGTIPLEDAEIWVYDNESDWDNFNDPLLTGTTDSEGLALFMNVEPVVYYIWAIREDSGGFWGSGGYTEALDQNEVNLFNVLCTWVEYQEKATRGIKGLSGKHSLPETKQ
jgi:PKD repeat protein